MDETLRFVGEHGGPVVFALVFVKQLGAPLLLGLGALAGTGRLDPLSSLAIGTAGSLLADLVWFELGRSKGSRMLGLLCKLSLEPDSCVSSTQGLFARHGVKSLLFAKFVPGYDTVAPPLAGLLGVGAAPFVLWSTGGALLWLGAYGGLGYVFSDRIAEVAAAAEGAGNKVGIAVVALFAAYLTRKVVQRQRVLAAIRMARITPDELNELITGGQGPVLVDVRNAAAFDVIPFVIPGALAISFEEIDARHGEIPREKNVVVYCS
jgi:membrane protein DedA with SNARE-associated domain